MKSLICSDIHDHTRNLEDAMQIAITSNCNSIICCGDLCAPFVMDLFNNFQNGPVHIVFGNNDGDRFGILTKANLLNLKRKPEQHLMLHGESFIKNKAQAVPGIPDQISLAVYHFPGISEMMGLSGKFDFVFYGHTHIASIELSEHSRIINPGSLMGFIPGEPATYVKPSCLIVDWESKNTDLIEL